MFTPWLCLLMVQLTSAAGEVLGLEYVLSVGKSLSSIANTTRGREAGREEREEGKAGEGREGQRE